MAAGILAGICTFLGIIAVIVACLVWDQRREARRRERLYREAMRRQDR